MLRAERLVPAEAMEAARRLVLGLDGQRSSVCHRPEPAPRGLWWDVRRCPSQTETDAIQIETDAILDMADLLVTSGLAAAGDTLLAVGSCATIQSPTIRAAIQAYIVQRGLSFVFAPRIRVNKSSVRSVPPPAIDPELVSTRRR